MHFIGKTTLDLRIPGSPGEAMELQQQAARLWEQEMLPALSATFDRLAGDDEIISIGRLEVGVRDLPPQRWQEELARRVAQAVAEAIEKQLFSQDKSTRPPRRSMAESHFEAWLHFLEHGSLPANRVTEDALQKAVLETVAAQTFAVAALLALLRRDERALQRLVWQHPEAFLQALAEAATGHSHQPAAKLRQEFDAVFAKAVQAQPTRREAVFPKKTAALKSFFISKKEKIAVAALQNIWKESFWEALWRHFLATEKPFESAALVERIFLEQLKTSDLPGIFQVLEKTAAAESGEFSLSLQTLTALRQKFLSEKTGRAKEEGILEKPVETPPEIQVKKEKTEPPPQDSSETPQPAKGKVEEKTARPEQTKSPDEVSQPAPARVEKAHWYVANAGVVLLHPFLINYFKAAGLLREDKQFRNERARHRAVYLLHYLATGETEVPEYDLVFAKHLCGLDPEKPLQNPENQRPKSKDQFPKTKDQKEADELLRAAIRHWEKLGSTTPDGLREGFLRRPGKLSFAPFDGWLLQVEQSGLDVLLGHLPWGISIVKLPWMKEILNVEWTF